MYFYFRYFFGDVFNNEIIEALITLKLTLKRIACNPYGTFGVYLKENVPFAVTLERPWLNNLRSKSCIPAMSYLCKRVNSRKFGKTFEVMSVPGRSLIRHHKGNLHDDSHGCILVGEEFGFFGDNAGIARSGDGFREYLKILNDVNEYSLKVIDLTF